MTFVIRKFKTHESVGDQLHAMRLELNLTLPDMVSKTKIRRSYLEAIEKGAYDRLPEPLYTRNLLKTYVHALGGDEEYFLDRFDDERGTCDFTAASRLPRKRARFAQFFSPTRLLKVACLVLVCLAIVTYLGFQIRSITSPPPLSLSSPEDGFTTDQAIIPINGKTDPRVTVRVNGREILIDRDGSFQTEVALERGLNIITVESSKRYSRPATVYRRVILKQERTNALNTVE